VDVVYGEVVRIHVKDEVITPEGKLDIPSIRPLARPGDFLALLVHEDRIKTMELLDRLYQMGWHAGDPLPRQD